MPTTITLAPLALAVRTIASRLSRVMSSGRPRSASLPPSSITTWLGLFCCSSAGRRERPPEVVSPLMLAFTTRALILSRARRCSSSATQPVPRARPYSADRLSPSTSTVLPAGPAATALPRPAPSAAASSRLQCSSTTSRDRRRVPQHSMSDPIIAIEHVTRAVTDSTGTFTILHDIDFTLQRRQSTAIVGASGSGKSTLLALIAGLDHPTTGTVRLDGEDIFALDEDQRAGLRARKLGFVFQSFQLLGHLSALENVMLPLELLGRRDARARATEMLQRVGLGERLGHYPRTLSGGEQQRVALARALDRRA